MSDVSLFITDSFTANAPLITNQAVSYQAGKDPLLNTTSSSLSCSSASVNSVLFRSPNSIHIVTSKSAHDTALSADSRVAARNNETSLTSHSTPNKAAKVQPNASMNLRTSISNLMANTFSSTPSKK